MGASIGPGDEEGLLNFACDSRLCGRYLKLCFLCFLSSFLSAKAGHATTPPLKEELGFGIYILFADEWLRFAYIFIFASLPPSM